MEGHSLHRLHELPTIIQCSGNSRYSKRQQEYFPCTTCGDNDTFASTNQTTNSVEPQLSKPCAFYRAPIRMHQRQNHNKYIKWSYKKALVRQITTNGRIYIGRKKKINKNVLDVWAAFIRGHSSSHGKIKVQNIENVKNQKVLNHENKTVSNWGSSPLKKLSLEVSHRFLRIAMMRKVNEERLHFIASIGDKTSTTSHLSKPDEM